MNLTTFKNLEWYILNETDKGKLLFLKDVFNSKQIKKFFKNKSMVDDANVKFNNDVSNPWYRDSYIRKELNSNLANFLGKENLNTMITTVELDGKKVTTEDKVRLITVEEARNLPEEVFKTEEEYGYWTMSPSSNISINNIAFVYYSNSLRIFDIPVGVFGIPVNHLFAVRPVIYLKNQSIITETDELNKEFQRLKKLIKL